MPSVPYITSRNESVLQLSLSVHVCSLTEIGNRALCAGLVLLIVMVLLVPLTVTVCLFVIMAALGTLVVIVRVVVPSAPVTMTVQVGLASVQPAGIRSVVGSTGIGSGSGSGVGAAAPELPPPPQALTRSGRQDQAGRQPQMGMHNFHYRSSECFRWKQNERRDSVMYDRPYRQGKISSPRIGFTADGGIVAQNPAPMASPLRWRGIHTPPAAGLDSPPSPGPARRPRAPVPRRAAAARRKRPARPGTAGGAGRSAPPARAGAAGAYSAAA